MAEEAITARGWKKRKRGKKGKREEERNGCCRVYAKSECGFSSNDCIGRSVAVTVSVHRFKFTRSPASALLVFPTLRAHGHARPTRLKIETCPRAYYRYDSGGVSGDALLLARVGSSRGKISTGFSPDFAHFIVQESVSRTRFTENVASCQLFSSRYCFSLFFDTRKTAVARTVVTSHR